MPDVHTEKQGEQQRLMIEYRKNRQRQMSRLGKEMGKMHVRHDSGGQETRQKNTAQTEKRHDDGRACSHLLLMVV